LAIRDQAENAQAKQNPKNWIEQPFVPWVRALFGSQQPQNVCLFEPHIAQMIDREVMRKRACENNAAYAACGRARHAVDYDAQVKLVANTFEKCEIGLLGVSLATIGPVQRCERSGLSAARIAGWGI